MALGLALVFLGPSMTFLSSMLIIATIYTTASVQYAGNIDPHLYVSISVASVDMLKAFRGVSNSIRVFFCDAI